MRSRRWSNSLLAFSIGLLLLTSSAVLPSGHSSSTAGTVCIASPSANPDSCPSTPALLAGLVGASTRFAVNIAGSTVFNEFSIMVKADPSVLNATSFDLSSSVLTSPSGAGCINGKPIGSISVCSAQDGPGIAHLIAAAGCAGRTLTCGFGSGNLFNINYKVVASTDSIPVAFQTGCTGTSNSTSCVTIQFITANILCCPPPDPENLQTATFNTGTVSITFFQTSTFEGVTATASGSISLNGTARTLTGHVSVSAVNSTTSKLFYSNSFSLNLTFSPGAGGLRFILKIPVSSGALASTCQVSFLLGNVLCFMSKTPDFNGNGVVDIIDVSMLAFAFGSSPGTARWNPAADLNGNGQVDIIDASMIAADLDAPVLG